jgi:hypothetical protein
MLLFECSNGTIRSPERGSVGRHAVFDEAMLETPHIDAAFKAQYDEREWSVVVKRRDALSTVTYPFNPLDAVGWHGDLAPVSLNVADIRPLVRLNVAVVVGEGDRMETGSHGAGGRVSYEYYLDPSNWRAQVDEAVNALRRVLQAIDAKAGVRGRAVVA